MNSPYRTQREQEARWGQQAQQMNRPELLRKRLGLDRPQMYGHFTGNLSEVKEGYLLAPGERR